MNPRRLLLCCCAHAALCLAYTYCEAPLPTYHAPPPGSTLLQARPIPPNPVLVVTRHGDRAPANVYPEEGGAVWDCAALEATGLPALTSAVAGVEALAQTQTAAALLPRRLWRGNCTPGQLTERGAMQHMRLGKRMREIYVDKLRLLPEKLDESQLFVRSTDVPRTRQSAIAHVAGLYPYEGETRVRLRVAPAELETMNPPSHQTACPRLGQIVAALKSSDEWNARQCQLADVRARLERAFGTRGLDKFANAFNPYSDNMHCSKQANAACVPRECHGMSTPVPASDVQTVMSQAEWELLAWSAPSGPVAPELSRLAIGFFLAGDLAPAMRSALAGDPAAPKYALFSAHDYTLAFLLSALGHRNERWPQYASHAVFEVLRMPSGAGAVRFVYNGEERLIEGCDASPCEWEQFARVVDALAVRNATSECALR
eukprot:m51a1_g3696 hypothetical protein (430) ;mRNA; f:379809-381702